MKSSSKKGFTLIELLVVVAIIGVLASIILSALGDARAKARDARRESDIKTIQNALEMYYVDHGQYPNGGWYESGLASGSGAWSNFETILGVNLPKDPVNEIGNPRTTPYPLNYAYYSASSDAFCNNQAYMLVYNKETEIGNGPNDGVIFCDGNPRSYGIAFVVGMSPMQ